MPDGRDWLEGRGCYAAGGWSTPLSEEMQLSPDSVPLVPWGQVSVQDTTCPRA